MQLSRLASATTFLVIIAIHAAAACANSASPYPVEVEQPTGERITLFLRGTEKLNWYEFVPEAADLTRAMMDVPENMERAQLPGFTVVRDDDGRYVFAALGPDGDWVPTDRVVTAEAPEDVSRRLLPSPEALQRMMLERLPEPGIPPRAASPVGTVKNLVILMRFADHQGRALPTREDMEVLFNSGNPHTTLAPTGSIREFYRENSYGKMTLDSTVVGWVTLPRTEKYYANGSSGLDARVRQAMMDALDVVRQQNLVNFKDFDNENAGVGDGWIDSITFVHSGYAAEFGGVAGGADYKDRIWSHRWVIPTWTDPATGVKVRDYNVNPGLWGTSGNSIGRIGVICHELGHFYGLPDLYDYSGRGEGAGSWCLMANSWGFDGSQLRPPHFNAWCKVFLGWNTPEVITSQKTYQVPASSVPEAKIFRVNYPSGSPDEYLLIENRQAIGPFDGGIPAGTGGRGGLAIWHIDDSKTANDTPGYPGLPGWPGNGEHYWVALLAADGKYDLERGNNRGKANDLYRAGHVDAINDSTIPSSSSYTGVKIPAIGAISASDRVMTFLFGDGSDERPADPSDTVLAGMVRPHDPTSHVVNFSPDGKAATLIFDQLFAEAGSNKQVGTTVATFSLPLKPGTDPASITLDIRGFVFTDDGSAASLVVQGMGNTVLVDLPTQSATADSPATEPSREPLRQAWKSFQAAAAGTASSGDIDQRLEWNITGEKELTITVYLFVDRRCESSHGGFLAIDTLDVEISP
jgi:M6 family metalloprotease-like protein